MPRLKTLATPVLIGAAVGALAFLAVDPDPAQLQAVEQVARPTRARAPASPTPSPPAWTVLGFRPLLSAPGAPPQTVASLSGIVLRPTPRALVSLGGAPARWLDLDEVSGEVKLINVAPDHADLDTPGGLLTVKLQYGGGSSSQPANSSPNSPR